MASEKKTNCQIAAKMEEPKVHHERIGKCNRLNFAGASSAVYKQGGGVTSG